MSLFISFEGPEGSGKTTQIKKLKEYLESLKYEVLTTLEPGGTGLSQKLREVLLYSKKNIQPLTELFLFLADRNHHVNDVIIPALKQNKIVISDRFIDSTLAYQGFGRGLDKKLIKKLNIVATHGLKPDLTIVLDMDISLGLKRANNKITGKTDRIENEKKLFHQKVRSGYIAIAKEEPKRVKIIKVGANSGIERIHKKIIKLVKILIFLKKILPRKLGRTEIQKDGFKI